MALQHRLGWYLKRLSVMGPVEIAHRLGEQLTLRRMAAEHGHFAPATPAAAPAFLTADERQLPDLPWDDSSLAQQSADLLAGRFPALAWSWQWSDDPLIWRLAPDTGRLWADTFFARISRAAGNSVGDVRVVWEPGRLQQLVALARLAAAGESPREAVDLLERQLLSWVHLNPPWSGVHYVSAMECALRVIAVCHAYDLVRDRVTRPTELHAAVLAMVGSHATLIERRLSLHSSAGNHTIAESAGLAYCGLLFPEFADAARWLDRGLHLLTSEYLRQVLEDGGGLEQSHWYLLFVTDLAGLVLGLLEHRGREVPAPLRERFKHAQRFIGEFAGTPDELPSIGDADDGVALSRELRLSFEVRPAPQRRRTFPSSGYTVLRSTNGCELICDHGPFGMAPSFGHAHADALSITLRRRGLDLLVDPGTFTYNGDPAWRSYFRSTAAHNTLMVDGRDQAVQETSFQWSAPATARLVKCEESGDVCRLLARHDGYLRDNAALAHWRGVSMAGDGSVLVWDWLEGRGHHAVAVHWHLGIDAQSLESTTWLLADGTRMEFPQDARVLELRGSSSPAGGWRSTRYGMRELILTLRVKAEVAAPWSQITRIRPPEGAGHSLDDAGEVARFRTWIDAA